MNDYHMTLLACDRARELHAEAERMRLVTTARRARRTGQRSVLGTRRFRIGLLFGRSPA